MNPKSYRILNNPASTRLRCPVCHEEVYGRGGIHPQCAVRQSDPPRPKSKAKLPADGALPSLEIVVDPVTTEVNATAVPLAG